MDNPLKEIKFTRLPPDYKFKSVFEPYIRTPEEVEINNRIEAAKKIRNDRQARLKLLPKEERGYQELAEFFMIMLPDAPMVKYMEMMLALKIAIKQHRSPKDRSQ